MVVGSGESHTATEDIQVNGYIIPKVFIHRIQQPIPNLRIEQVLRASICVLSKTIWLGKKNRKNSELGVGSRELHLATEDIQVNG